MQRDKIDWNVEFWAIIDYNYGSESEYARIIKMAKCLFSEFGID